MYAYGIFRGLCTLLCEIPAEQLKPVCSLTAARIFSTKDAARASRSSVSASADSGNSFSQSATEAARSPGHK